MRRYYLTSTAAHLLLLAALLFSPFLRRGSGPALMVDGFDYVGGGAGAGTNNAGPKKEQMGQVVPQPVKVPSPEKAAPIQHETKAEEAWKVKKAPAKPTPPPRVIQPPAPVAEQTHKETTNIIRRGVAPDTKAGESTFDFGSNAGRGQTDGKGVGIGLGPGGEGQFGGFGGYFKVLRQRIWSEWTQSAVYGTNESCVIGFTVHTNGDTTDIKVEKSSGNGFYDSVALRAVRNASPMPPLPSDFHKPEQRILVQFRLEE